MPAIRRYRVTEIREVLVDANNPVDAVRIGAIAFTRGQSYDGRVDDRVKQEELGDVYGNTVSQIRTIDISATED
jgi:hypothetical protein